jgi:hypothetical protein
MRGDSRVDLCGANVGVSEQCLNDGEFGSVFKQMAGEGMAQQPNVDGAC